jgi:hypothetical protein
MDDPMLNKRDLLKQIGIAGVAATGMSGMASAKKRYPTVDDLGVYEDAPLNVYAIEAAKQQHHDRAVFTTTAFGNGYELYIADGVSSVEDVPETVYKMTSSSLFINNLEWLHGNRLRYEDDFQLLIRKIPLSNKMFEPEIVDENTLKGGD